MLSCPIWQRPQLVTAVQTTFAPWPLVEVALEYALQVLKPGGHFLTKTFQGGTEQSLLNLMKQNFKSIHHVKPPASRSDSVELYLLAKNRK